MSETVEMKNLAALAGLKGVASRGEPDAKARYSSLKSTRKGSFDGFLNTFLGRDASGGKPASRAGQGERVSAARSADRRVSAKSVKKDRDSEPIEDDASGECSSEEAAAAAEEAALLIWNLLYGVGFAGGADGSLANIAVPGGLRRLAALINGINQGGESAAPDLLSAVDAVPAEDGIETANASAEMNSAAVLSALDELLEGMPRQALGAALERTAARFGLDGPEGDDLFNAVAKALDVEVLSVNAATGRDLLAALSSSAAPGIAPLSAESAGLRPTANEILAMFENFVANVPAGSDAESVLRAFSSSHPAAAEALGAAFAGWLKEPGNANQANGLSSHGPRLAEMPAAAGDGADGSGGEAAGGIFSSFLRNLEKTLQSSPGKAADRQNVPSFSLDAADGAGQGFSAAGSPGADRGGAEGLAAGVAAVPQAGGQTGAQPSPAASIASGLLEQMENIERLAEAMRLARGNGLSNITLKMSPSELGAVSVRVQSRNGVVSAFLRTEKPDTADKLAANLGQLRETLREMGIELAELDIRPGRQDAFAGDMNGGGRWRETGGDTPAARESGGADAPEASPTETERHAPAGPGNLNLIA